MSIANTTTEEVGDKMQLSSTWCMYACVNSKQTTGNYSALTYSINTVIDFWDNFMYTDLPSYMGYKRYYIFCKKGYNELLNNEILFKFKIGKDDIWLQTLLLLIGNNNKLLKYILGVSIRSRPLTEEYTIILYITNHAKGKEEEIKTYFNENVKLPIYD